MSSLDFTYENLEQVVPRHFFGTEALVTKQIDPKRAALLVMDVQKLIVDPDGVGYVASVGGAPEGKDIVQPCAEVIEKCRELGMPVYWSLWGLRGDGKDAGRTVEKWPPLNPGAPDSPASWGNRDAELADGLEPRDDEPVMYKHRFCSMYNTPLDEYMREGGRDTLVIIGPTSANCMHATAIEAWNKNYKVICLADTTTAIPNMLEDVPNGYGQHWEALRNIQMNYGDVRTRKEFFEMIK